MTHKQFAAHVLDAAVLLPPTLERPITSLAYACIGDTAGAYERMVAMARRAAAVPRYSDFARALGLPTITERYLPGQQWAGLRETINEHERNKGNES